MAVNKLHIFEKATLLQFVLDKGLPSWSKKSLAPVLAKLCGVSEKDAEAAFERAVACGYLSKRKGDAA